MDSGTTAILMSDADSARVHAAVPGLSYNAQGGYYAVTGGCDAVASLPDITFVLGGRPYAVPARLWTQQIPKPGGSGVACISGIIPGGDSNSIILGDNFLRAWYTAYRYDKSAHTAFVGLAKPTDIKLSLPGDDAVGGAGVKAVATPSSSSSKAAAVASQAKASASSEDEGSEVEAAVDDSSSSNSKKSPIRIGPIAFAPPRGMRGGMGGGKAAPRAEGLMATRSASPSASSASAGRKAPTSIGAEQTRVAPSAAGSTDGMSSTSFGTETGR